MLTLGSGHWGLGSGVVVGGARVMIGDIRVELYYVWEIPGDPSRGGLVVMAEGSF